jgi:ABC-type uncharacterized transport system fused permease/ATPase subunit
MMLKICVIPVRWRQIFERDLRDFFFAKRCRFRPQTEGKKAENAITRKRPADNNIDLEQRFKKATEFFSKLIECICGFVVLTRLFWSDSATVSQIIFIEYLCQLG